MKIRNPFEDIDDPPQIDALAIAAHPDDVEQTCGGTLIKLAEIGYKTGVIDLTAGDMGSRGTPELRVEESAVAADNMMLTFRGNMKFPDARLETTLAGKLSLAGEIRRLKPRLVILPYWEARHPDHSRTCEIAYEACFIAGLAKLDHYTEPHRPRKVLYAASYANVPPAIVVDITRQFDRRMEALLSYRSQYGASEASHLFPEEKEIRERLEMTARFYGNLIGVKYGEPYAVKEPTAVDDVMLLGPKSF
jgi:bacillithiol biosynthesis deacetylase BshB1